jgi:hypothetical protein
MKSKYKILIALILIAVVGATYFAFSERVLLVTYELIEGCEVPQQRIETIVLMPDGKTYFYDSQVEKKKRMRVQSSPTLANPDVDSIREPEVEYREIVPVDCVGGKKNCIEYEFTKPSRSRVTVLREGEWLKTLGELPYSTSTEIDEIQSYFTPRGVRGIVIELKEEAPSCLHIKVLGLKSVREFKSW